MHRATRLRANDLVRTLVAISSAIALAGCSSAAETGGRSTPATSAIASAKKDPDRFDHALHTGSDPRIAGYKNRGLMCEDCHPKEAVLAGDWARPGKNDHAPCDDCHRDEFYKPPGKFCKNCHTEVNPFQQGATQMQPYPERGFQRILAARFSHRVHLDKAAMDGAVGFHVGCSDCHARDADSRDPVMPGHKQCARCHAEQDKARAALSMGDCSNCHPKRDVELARGRLFITGDLVFAHADHEKDRAGNAIDCAMCHSDVAASRSAEEVSVPAMVRCAECHEDSARTPARVRIARCDVCHTQITSGTPPRNHLIGGAGELPEDHTLEFRRNHSEQAASKNARCAFCHQGLGGNNRDSCFQCHQLMKPRDHNLGWREDEHGRDAASDTDRCTVCHDAEYCTACHSIPPRSHQPFIEFKLGGHAQPARFDLRSCFACHTYDDTCVDCHRGSR